MVVLEVLAWLGVTLGLLVGILLLTLLLDSLVAEIRRGGSVKVTTDLMTNDPVTTIILPGILARCQEQVEPVVDSLARAGEVLFIDYVGLRLNVDQVVKLVKNEIEDAMDRHHVVNLVGVSLGGALIPRILEQCSSTDWLGVIVIDAPAGVKTLAPLPLPAAPVAKALLGFFEPGVLSNLWGNLILKLMAVPPKRENIEVPTGYDVEVYQDDIIAQAKQNLSGHKFSMWWSQLAFMCRDDVPYDSLAKVTVGYYWCGLGDEDANDTVRQPDALEAWRPYISGKRRVESAHAGFLERQPTWNKAFLLQD